MSINQRYYSNRTIARFLVMVLLFCLAPRAASAQEELSQSIQKINTCIYRFQFDEALSRIRALRNQHPLESDLLHYQLDRWRSYPIFYSIHEDSLWSRLDAIQSGIEKSEDHMSEYFQLTFQAFRLELGYYTNRYMICLQAINAINRIAKSTLEGPVNSMEEKFIKGIYLTHAQLISKRMPVAAIFLEGNQNPQQAKLGMDLLKEVAETPSICQIEARFVLSILHFHYDIVSDDTRVLLMGLVRDFPENYLFRYRLIDCYLTIGDTQQAKKMLSETPFNRSPHEMVTLCYQKALTSFQSGEFHDAREWLRKCRELSEGYKLHDHVREKVATLNRALDKKTTAR